MVKMNCEYDFSPPSGSATGGGGGGGGSISELTVFIVTNSTAALGTTPVLRGGYSIFECKSRLNL